MMFLFIALGEICGMIVGWMLCSMFAVSSYQSRLEEQCEQCKTNTDTNSIEQPRRYDE